MSLQSLYDKVASGKFTLSVIGVGRVGLPLSLAFANKGVKVLGVDANAKHVESLKSGIVPFKEDHIEKYFPSGN
ncbi:hypothetical protein HYU20_02805, partial [Candidatus Woesearchaeota archaeon]|nr:hypothetical protein [Candidatus Woesearchaeota archaeon]